MNPGCGALALSCIFAYDQDQLNCWEANPPPECVQHVIVCILDVVRAVSP